MIRSISRSETPAAPGAPADFDAVVDAVRRLLVEREQPPTPMHIGAALRSLPGIRTHSQLLATVAAVGSELSGAGPLQRFLDEPAVTDVLVHAGGQVWVDRGDGPKPAGLSLDGEDAVRQLAVRLVASAGRRLDAASPYADAVLPGGTRVHAVLPPVAVDGTVLSIRALRPGRFGLDALIASGTVPAGFAEPIRGLLAAGVATVITGATGAGKTTLLAALIGALPADLRVVVVEDAAELHPSHPHVVRLQARDPNVEGIGAIPLRDLVRQALRMRPDRLVLGEVRGAEVIDLLVALNTGHVGGLCTVHANSLREVPARIEALGVLGGVPRAAVHSLLAPALRAAVHIERVDGRRAVTEVGVFTTAPDGSVHCRAALVAGPAGPVPTPDYALLRAELERAA